MYMDSGDIHMYVPTGGTHSTTCKKTPDSAISYIRMYMDSGDVQSTTCKTPDSAEKEEKRQLLLHSR